MKQEPFRGTDYIPADLFLDRIAGTSPGKALVYATGDLAYSAPFDADLARLRKTVWGLYEQKKITLTQRIRPDRGFMRGGRAFDYIATKCREKSMERA
jgi:hypothetical protein